MTAFDSLATIGSELTAEQLDEVDGGAAAVIILGVLAIAVIYYVYST